MQSIEQYISERQEDILEFLKKMVSIESPSQDGPAVDEVIDMLEEAYKTLGFKTRRIPHADFGAHLVADSGDGPGPRVLLVGHADTVFPKGTLKTMPLRIDGDRLRGPGVVDMKGGLTVMLSGVQALCGLRDRLKGAVRIVINSDEEPGSPTSRSLWPELTKDVDWALVFEPALEDGALIHQRKGVGVFRLKVRGKAAHAALLDKGVSAIRVLARKIEAIEAMTDHTLGTTLNVGVVSGGTLPYVVPDQAEAQVDIRVPDGQEQKRIVSRLEALCEQVEIPGASCEVTGGFHRPPMAASSEQEPLRQVVESEGQAMGMSVRWEAQGVVSDGNNIAQTGVPTLDGMGPAGAGAHGVDEYLDIPSLFQKSVLLGRVLDRLVGREGLSRR